MKKYANLQQFFDEQEKTKLEQVQLIRQMILDFSHEIKESLKWNAPSYSYKNEDRITFNLMNKNNKVQVIFHLGAKRKEDKNADPILKGDFTIIKWVSDIRGIVEFNDLEDVKLKSKEFKKLIQLWLEI